MSKPVIVVIGATGTQGGPVARSLMKSGDWKVRCITRKEDSQNAKNLKSMGMEVCHCDAMNKDELRKCLEGAYGIYAMTNFYDKECGGEDGEYKMGCLIADIAKEKGIKHFVWSSLDNCHKLSNGKYRVPMFTGKNRVEEYVCKKGFPICTLVYPGFYMQNFHMDAFKPTKVQDKVVFKCHIPDTTKFCLVNIEDLGPVVAEVFKGKDKYNNMRIPVVGSVLTMRQIVDHYERATGTKAELQKTSKDDCAKKLGKDLTEMLDYFAEFGHFREFKDMDMAKRLYPNMTTWDQWVKQNPLV